MRASAWLRHQQQRWLRSDAHFWVRPDAARFLIPGTKVEDIYPALSRKYSPNQLRIQAGNPGGGRWTRDGTAAGNRIAQPMGSVDVGDLSGSTEFGDLFQTAPSDVSVDGVQFAGELPDDTNKTSLEDPAPKVPQDRPETTEGRMGLVRDAAQWVARNAGRYAPAVNTFFEALDQVEQLNKLTDAIKSANDPAKTLTNCRPE